MQTTSKLLIIAFSTILAFSLASTIFAERGLNRVLKSNDISYSSGTFKKPPPPPPPGKSTKNLSHRSGTSFITSIKNILGQFKISEVYRYNIMVGLIAGSLTGLLLTLKFFKSKNE